MHGWKLLSVENTCYEGNGDDIKVDENNHAHKDGSNGKKAFAR